MTEFPWSNVVLGLEKFHPWILKIIPEEVSIFYIIYILCLAPNKPTEVLDVQKPSH